MKPLVKIKTVLVLLLLLAVLPLCGEALGDFEYDFQSRSLDEVLEVYMAEYGLTEDNFAMGWYDLESGAQWYFGADRFMVAGSMYKLPLNMAYTDMLASGDLQPDDMTGQYTVSRAMELSIVYSDNAAAQELESFLRLPYRDYRLMLAQYSGLNESELPEEYFSDNRISPRFMINTLVYLYDNTGLYSGLIENMKLAHPGRYFKKSEGEYEIAHKYGYYEGVLNDCAVVYAPRPFALAAFTSKVRPAENALAALCELMTGYSLYLDSLPEPEHAPPPTGAVRAESETAGKAEPEGSAATEAAAESKAELEPNTGAEAPADPDPEPEPVPEDTVRVSSRPFWGLYAAVCAVLLCAAGVRQLFIRKRRTAGKGGHRH